MKITIIGGSGFIGTDLISGFDSGYEIKNIDKKVSDQFSGISTLANVCNAIELEPLLTDSDYVILLAAEHRDDVSPSKRYYDVNVEGAKNVIRAMDKQGIKKLIFTSSVAIFGLNKDNPDENHEADPFNDYGKSKWMAEEVLKEWYHNDPVGKTLIIIRPTVVFGRGNKGNVYNLLKQIISGRFMMIGRGENKKSMAYVKNVSAFIRHCISSGISGFNIFNYADKPDLTMNELIKNVESALDKKIIPVRIPYAIGYFGGLCFDLFSWILRKKLPVSSVRIKKFCATTQFSSSSIASTGFKAPYELNEALKYTIKGIKEESEYSEKS